MHREKLKTLAYLAKADGEGVLIRSFMENDPDEIDLLHKRSLEQAHLQFSGHRLIRLRERVVHVADTAARRKAWSPTRRWRSGWWGTPGRSGRRWSGCSTTRGRQLTHFTGDLDDFANIYRPYTVTPYSPELGWVLHVGEAGSPSSSALLTGAFRAIGLKAEQFITLKGKFRAGSVEADGETYYYDGNDFRWVTESETAGPICFFLQNLGSSREPGILGLWIATSDAGDSAAWHWIPSSLGD